MGVISKKENLDIAGVMDVLNKNPVCTECSGLSSDMRDLEDAAAEGNVDARMQRELLDTVLQNT